MKFQVLAGFHYEGTERYNPGEVFESSRDMLKYANKFQRVSEDTPVSHLDADRVNQESLQTANKSLFGSDVTDEFPMAEDCGFTVCKAATGYAVLNPRNPLLSLNEHPLEREKVEPFLAEYLEERVTRGMRKRAPKLPKDAGGSTVPGQSESDIQDKETKAKTKG